MRFHPRSGCGGEEFRRAGFCRRGSATAARLTPTSVSMSLPVVRGWTIPAQRSPHLRPRAIDEEVLLVFTSIVFTSEAQRPCIGSRRPSSSRSTPGARLPRRSGVQDVEADQRHPVDATSRSPAPSSPHQRLRAHHHLRSDVAGLVGALGLGSRSRCLLLFVTLQAFPTRSSLARRPRRRCSRSQHCSSSARARSRRR